MKIRNRIVAGLLLLTLATVNTIAVPGSFMYVQAEEASYMVSFVSDTNEFIDVKQVASGKTIEEPTAPAKSGYTFLGWYTEDGIKFDFTTPITKNMKLSQKWEENKEQKSAKEAFEAIEAKKKELVQAHYEEAGWTQMEVAYQKAKKEYDKGDKMDASTLSVLVGTLQVATDALVKKKVTVTIKSPGGIQTRENTVEIGSTVGAPETPVRGGYVFLGWYLDDMKFDFSTPIEEDTVLIAKWEEDDELKAAKAAFKTVSDKISGMDEKLYTEDSWKKLLEAYNAAKDGFEMADAAVIYQLTESLEDVIKNLVLKEAPATPGINQENKNQEQKKQEVKVTEIEISETITKLAAGKKVTLSADVMPEDATNKEVIWSSSNKKVATVNADGVVKAKKIKKAKKVTIIAKAADGSGIVAEYEIKVMPQAVEKIKLTAPATTVTAGEKITVTAEVSPAVNKKLINSTVEWVTNNTKYATINAKGVLKTKAAGKGKTVKVTAVATDGSNKKATIKIKLI